MNFIKKVFRGEYGGGGFVHLQFQKFSKGEFRNRAIINAKKSGSKYTISTSSEFANELVKIAVEKLGRQKTKVTGAIVSTGDLTGKIEFKEKKQFQGVKRYIIEKEISGDEILSLLNNFPRAFFALSFETDEMKLKIKPKAPKSGKPGTKGDEKPSADFCRLVTTDKSISKDFVFEVPDFKNAVITHHFIINDIIWPKETSSKLGQSKENSPKRRQIKEEKDYAKIRELAKRKGKIIRIANIDGRELRSEKEFEA